MRRLQIGRVRLLQRGKVLAVGLRDIAIELSVGRIGQLSFGGVSRLDRRFVAGFRIAQRRRLVRVGRLHKLVSGKLSCGEFRVIAAGGRQPRLGFGTVRLIGVDKAEALPIARCGSVLAPRPHFERHPSVEQLLRLVREFAGNQRRGFVGHAVLVVVKVDQNRRRSAGAGRADPERRIARAAVLPGVAVVTDQFDGLDRQLRVRRLVDNHGHTAPIAAQPPAARHVIPRAGAEHHVARGESLRRVFEPARRIDRDRRLGPTVAVVVELNDHRFAQRIPIDRASQTSHARCTVRIRDSKRHDPRRPGLHVERRHDVRLPCAEPVLARIIAPFTSPDRQRKRTVLRCGKGVLHRK